MRAFMLLGFLTTMGALAMSDTANGDDKKKPDTDKKEAYDEKVAVRIWQGDKFANPIKDVPMFRWEISGKPVMYLWALAGGSRAPKGSEIIDKDGVTWVVGTQSKRGANFDLCYVTKKPAEEKP
jgi:hypothetical protein